MTYECSVKYNEKNQVLVTPLVSIKYLSGELKIQSIPMTEIPATLNCFCDF